MKKLFLYLVCSIALYATSLQEAWELMEHKSDALKAQQQDVAMAKSKQESATSMYLPSVSLTGSYTHLSEPLKLEDEIDLPFNLGVVPFRLDLSEQDVFLANLHALWPLYTGGKIDAAQDIYTAGVDEAKALTQMKKDEEFVTLVKYYYGVVVSKSLYETRLQAQRTLEQHYSNAQKLHKNGQISNVELLNAQVKLDNARIETTKAKHNYEIAQEALRSITKQNIFPTTPLFVSGFEKEEAEYENATRQNASALKIIDAKQKKVEAVLQIKEAAWHPEVVGFANYNLYKDNSIISQSLPQWFAGVMVKIDILQRKDRSQEIQSAKLLEKKVHYLRKDALEKLSLLVVKTYKEMMSAKEEYEALTSSIELAKENLRLRQISFKEGLSTSVELTEAQTLLLAAQTKRLNAAYTYEQKLAQLCVLSGEREQFFEFAQGKNR